MPAWRNRLELGAVDTNQSAANRVLDIVPDWFGPHNGIRSGCAHAFAAPGFVCVRGRAGFGPNGFFLGCSICAVRSVPGAQPTALARSWQCCGDVSIQLRLAGEWITLAPIERSAVDGKPGFKFWPIE